MGGDGYTLLEVGVIVISGDAHNLSTEFAEDRALFWLGVDVRPHLIGGAVFEDDFTLANFVLNVKILNLDVFGTFCAAGLAVGFEEDCAHIVLVHERQVHVVTLCSQEVPCPKDVAKGVVDPDEFCLRRAFCVDLLFPVE